MISYWIYVAWLTAVCVGVVFGHGKLWEPPGRSSMWRRGFVTPINPNDNELNCGGYENQWIHQDGRCGICGDPYQDLPRANEAGGKFATGIISRKYKSGDVINLAADLTANHLGFFEFRVCPTNDIYKAATQDCFDQHPIWVEGTKDGRFYVDSSMEGIINMTGRLPSYLSCKHCVLQWRYKSGNRWNCDVKDRCGHGKGPQEEFYGCADIEIIRDFKAYQFHSRKDRTHIFEPLETQLKDIRRSFRSIPRNEPLTKGIYLLDNAVNNESKTKDSLTIENVQELPLNADLSRYDTVTMESASNKNFKSSFHNQEHDYFPKRKIEFSMKSKTKMVHPWHINTDKKEPEVPRSVLETTPKQMDIKTTQHNGKKVAILERLSSQLWSLLRSVLMQTHKRNGQNLALLKWNDKESLGKTPAILNRRKHDNPFQFNSASWPPSRPVIVQADYGIEDVIEGNPILLSEISTKDYLKSPLKSPPRDESMFSLLHESKMNEIDSFSKQSQEIKSRLLELKNQREIGRRKIRRKKSGFMCTGAESFRTVKGINNWCTRNCKAGNCPRRMCKCTKSHEMIENISLVTKRPVFREKMNEIPPPIIPEVQFLSSETKRLQDRIKNMEPPPITPSIQFLSKQTKNKIFNDRRKERTTNVNYLSREAYMDLWNKNPTIHSPEKTSVRSFSKKQDNSVFRKHFFSDSKKSRELVSPKSKEMQKSNLVCIGANQYEKQMAIRGWCTENCRKGFCPKRVCSCTYEGK